MSSNKKSRPDTTVTTTRFATLARLGPVLLVVAAMAIGFLGVRWYQSNARPPQPIVGDGQLGPADMAWVPGGDFLMGSDHKLSQPNERPAHKARVGGFWMDRHHVTNAQFRAFVDATG